MKYTLLIVGFLLITSAPIFSFAFSDYGVAPEAQRVSAPIVQDTDSAPRPIEVMPSNVRRPELPPAPPIAPVARPINSDGRTRIHLPPVPPIIPASKATLADCIGAPSSSDISDTGSGISPSIPDATGGDTFGFNGGDIDTLINQIMMQASHEQEQELKDLMDQLKVGMKEKRKLRDAKTKLGRLADCIGTSDVTRSKIQKVVLPFIKAIDGTDGKESPRLVQPQFQSSDDFKIFLTTKARNNPGIKTLDISSTTAHVILHRHAKLFGVFAIGYDADVSIGETGSTTVKGPWWLFASSNDIKDLTDSTANTNQQLDLSSEMGEMESLRFQMAQERLAKMLGTLSNILAKSASTTSSITANLK